MSETYASVEETLTESEESRCFAVWIWMTFAIVAAGILVSIASSVYIDSFGLHGRRSVSIYALERFSKYLMSYRYIPDNFDGVLLGNSVAAAWETEIIRGTQVFNLSLRGSNISEQKIMLDKVLATGHLRTAFIVLYPTLTSSHGLQTAYMTPQDYRASFGSVQDLMIYVHEAGERIAGPDTRFSFFRHKFSPYGAFHFFVPTRTGPFQLFTRKEILIDPVAERELIEVVEELHSKNVKLFAVIGPIYTPKRDAQRVALDAWTARILSHFSEADRVIDLNDDALAPLLSERSNFPDYWHLSESADGIVMRYLADKVEAIK